MISFVSLWLILPCLFGNAMAFAPPSRTNHHHHGRVATPVFVGEAPRVSPTIVLLSSSSTASAMNVPEGASSSSSPHLVNNNNNKYEQHRRDWIDRSVTYYSKVMREERQRSSGQWKYDEQGQDMDEFVLLAKKHYFAIRKVKDGKFSQAEVIYRKIIHDILNTPEDEHCDHAKLAVTTLLLALLTKRMGDPKKTRSVFLHFFRVAVLQRNDNEETECACSAKVLQAYALFEMQQGNPLKSLEIVQQALQFDKTLAPVLQWKQFRDARAAYKKYAKQRATVTTKTITTRRSNTQVAP